MTRAPALSRAARAAVRRRVGRAMRVFDRFVAARVRRWAWKASPSLLPCTFRDRPLRWPNRHLPVSNGEQKSLVFREPALVEDVGQLRIATGLVNHVGAHPDVRVASARL